MTKNTKEAIFAYIGTYTAEGKSEGIYVYRVNPATGDLELSSKAAGVINPTYLAIHPQNRYLYAVNTIDEGTVSAFKIDADTGELTFLNSQPSGGSKPIHLIVDQTGKFVLVANYGSGSVSVLPIQEDGKLGEVTDLVQHEGSSIHPRQQGPHAHSITLDPYNRHAIVAEFGADKVMMYQFDSNSGKLKPGLTPSIDIEAGAGPRHFAFHPDGKHAYLINEFGNSLIVFDYDKTSGTITPKETIPTLPEDFSGESTTADVHIDKAGKFLYGSNRGFDSIVIQEIDPDTGKLQYVGHEPSQGIGPRSFIIDPTGNYIIVTHQLSDSIVVFRIDHLTGKLVPTGNVNEISSPVCVKTLSFSS